MKEVCMSKRNILLIVVCGIAVILIYTIDLFKLNYRMTGWEEFSGAPVAISHVQYFLADTPNLIGYTDHALGEAVTCSQSVAFVGTDAKESYRCCDTGEQISCLEGDFTSDIPPADEKCVAELQNIFGVPVALEGSKEYQLYGSCSGGRFADLTVMQLTHDGRILWKLVEVSSIQTTTSVLRCVLGPLLLLVILYILYKLYQEKTAAPVRRI